MRVLSFGLGLLAVASLALASACRPGTLETFHLVIQSTDTPDINGDLLLFFSDFEPLNYDLPGLPAGVFSLEAGTGYLMVVDPSTGDLLPVKYVPSDGGVLLLYSNYNFGAPVACSGGPAVAAGVALICSPVGSPTISVFSGSGSPYTNAVYMYAATDPNSQVVRIDLVPQAVA